MSVAHDHTADFVVHSPLPEDLRRRARAAWVSYDIANTIFSFAIVSEAMGL